MKIMGPGGGSAAPEMSVVMAVFNGERYLRQAVESTLGQTLGDFELLIVDGSTDGTPAILDEYRHADRRVGVVRQSNAGQALALNRGCGLARGTYVARIDADDISMKGRLSLQVGFLRRNGRVGLLGGAVDLIDSRGGGSTEMVAQLTTGKSDASSISIGVSITRRWCFGRMRGA